MRLTEARIKNFKGIEEWNLKFQPGFNLLKGENGTGKSSILDALALGLGTFVEWAIPKDVPMFTTNNVRKQYQRQGDGSATLRYQFPSEVALTAAFSEEGKTISWTKSQDTVPYVKSPGKLDSQEIISMSKEMANDTKKSLSILCYRSVLNNRRLITHNGRIDILDYINAFDYYDLNQIALSRYYESMRITKPLKRMDGYANMLSGRSDTFPLLNWCNQMERVQLQKDREIREYEAVKRAVAFFMESMEPGRHFRVFYDNQLSDLMCEVESGEVLPISDFSSGYQVLLWLAMDIAWQMAQLNPFLLDRITDTPGVVLIDELDLHLHPKWQWRVIDALRTVFPNVQFIAATHAPILFASANDVWIVNLDTLEPSYQWSRYGLDINTAVSEYQGDYTLPERVRKIADEVSDAINDEDYPKAKEKLEELEQEVAPKPGDNGGSVSLADPPLLTELRARYDIESSWPEV